MLRTILIILLCLMFFAACYGEKVSQTVSTTATSGVHFYANETLSVTCKVTDIADSSVFDNIGLVYIKSPGLEEYVQCAMSVTLGGDLRWTPSPGASFSAPDCMALPTTLGFNQLEITLLRLIKKDMVGSQIKCFSQNTNRVYTLADPLNITTVNVAPDNLVMTFNPSEPKEGEEFTVSCTSVNGDPSPQFVYNIISDGVSKTSTVHTPTDKDRDGIAVKCIDEKHPNLLNKSNTVKEVTVLPRYLTVGGDMTRSRKLKPGYPYTLECTVSSRPTEVTYTWSRNAEILTDVTRTLSVRSDSVKSEVVICTASLPGTNIANVSITWDISWEEDAPAPTSQTPSPAPISGGGVDGAVIGGAVGAVVVVALIAGVIVYFVLKRKRADNPGTNSVELANSGKSSSGPPKPRERTSIKKPAPKHPEKEEIVYASLDLGEPQPVTVPVSRAPPPPEVEYASIDINRTRQAARPQQRQQHDDGQTYQNIPDRRQDK